MTTTGPFDSPPAAERPATPSAAYGTPRDGGELVTWAHVAERLEAASAYWLATVGPGSRPHAVPVWGALIEGELYLETGGAETAKVRHLAANPAVWVHLPDPEDVVVVTGTAETWHPGPRVGALLAARMREKYAGYTPEALDWEDGGLHRVVPATVLAWRDMPTATRWRFVS